MGAPIQTPMDVGTDYAALRFVITQILSELDTVTLVKVVSCTNSGGIAATGTVVVQPLVNQVSGDGTAQPHGQLYALPYFRLVGGTNAVILDPQPGDIGMAAFCSRDITAVKSPAGVSQIQGGEVPGLNPSSARSFSMSDGLYLGGFLNGVPVQYVDFAASGITVVSPTKITLQAPEIDLKGAVVQTGGDVSMSGTLTVAVEVNAGPIPIPLTTHKHPTAGTGPPSEPIP